MIRTRCYLQPVMFMDPGDKALNTREKIWTLYRSYYPSARGHNQTCIYSEMRMTKRGYYIADIHYEVDGVWKSERNYARLISSKREPVMRVSPDLAQRGLDYTLHFWTLKEHCVVFLLVLAGKVHCEVRAWQDHVRATVPLCRKAYESRCELPSEARKYAQHSTGRSVVEFLHTYGKIWSRYRSFEVGRTTQRHKCIYAEIRRNQLGQYVYGQHYEVGHNWISQLFDAEALENQAKEPVFRIKLKKGRHQYDYILRFWSPVEQCAVFTISLQGKPECEMQVWEHHIKKSVPMCQLSYKKYCVKQFPIYTRQCEPPQHKMQGSHSL
ncbi:uncharacterized protein LOC142587462 isoform X2 [Dermacentor variabilis]|uniref:uncharacterized protein LOC142587462 isoform X2 n=1 Tax=Dermacentor variabilis TaxID=34621 RepID=UPI003F5AEC11